MVSRVKAIAVVLMVVLAMGVLVACASPSSSTPSSASSSDSSSSIVMLDGEDIVTLSLDYNAGTGYEWVPTVEPEGIVTFVSQDTVSSADSNAVGGPQTERFTYRAASPGEVTLTFNLVRSWEAQEEPAETQVFVFTVSPELKMVLNPYKSQCDHEPEWGSNA